MKPPRVVLETDRAIVVAADLGAGGPASEVLREPAFASLADLRAVGIEAAPSSRVQKLLPWLWPDPLSFIGRAANEAT